jgi:hypothetical protein
MVIAPNSGARKPFDTGVRDHIDVILEIGQPADAATDLFYTYMATSSSQPYRQTDNYVAIRINYIFSCVIIVRLIARINLSKDLPKKELPPLLTCPTYQLSFKFLVSYYLGD